MEETIETNTSVEKAEVNKENNNPGQKKYARLAFQFSIKILAILIISFVIQNILIVQSVQKYSQNDYSSFSEKIIEEDAGKIQHWNEVLVNDLRIYSDNDVTKEGNEEKIINWLLNHENIRNKYFNYIMFCTPDGVGHSSDGKTLTVISKPFFRSIMNDKKNIYVSNIDFQTDGSVCYYIARPAYDLYGQLIGVFAGAVKLDEIDKMISNLTMGENGKAILVGSNGVLISHIRGMDKYMDLSYSDKAGFKGLNKIAEKACSGLSGEGYYTDAAGVYTFASYTPVPGTPWSAILTIPQSQIDAAGKSIGTVIIIISILVGLLVSVFCSLLLVVAVKPLRVVQNSIQHIASGDADLTQQIVVKSKNEIGALGDGFNSFMNKLRTIIGGVKDSKEMLGDVNVGLQKRIEENGNSIGAIIEDLNNIGSQVQNQADCVTETASAVEEISQNIESLERMIETQSSGVTQASAAVEEMIGNIRSVNVSVGHMAKSFESLTNNAEDGIKRQNDVNVRIKHIEEQSKTLQTANKTINDIAKQTNMLAMNAAIEAAHAGKAGQGFSVVADEIRKLSETSSAQSKTIRDELNKIESSINDVVTASQASSDSFAAVNDSINQTKQLVLQIKAAMEEQQEGSKQIGDALKLMNDNTSEVRAASHEMSEGNKSILSEVDQLRNTTGVIRQSMDKISTSAGNIQDTSNSLSEIADSVEAAVGQIGDQIDLFTV
ncbi:methyl-accepting chemotaxis protein [Treponema sp.]|uniref:methyl-accepting chemotaxis protein n=1 Tax=Treponema sp. TaxID=166 RepID=UPI0025D5ED70|nr:methyl-accepting chemotaxis protein [Treponema sp.]MCR5217479.1 HAMP domain-containing protein [Treponema sp.]